MVSEKDKSRGILFSDHDNPAAILSILSTALGRCGGEQERGRQGTSASLRLSRRH